jgi:hypothetical protein
MVVPQKIYVQLEAVNMTLYGKKVSTDAINGLEMRFPRSNDKCPYKFKYKWRNTGTGDVKTEAQIGVVYL